MIQHKQTEHGLYVHTVVAYRRKGTNRWELTCFPYAEADVAEAFVQSEIEVDEFRIVSWYGTMLGLGDFGNDQKAIQRGWIPDHDGHYWNAPGEPVPEYPDCSRDGHLIIELDSMAYGYLHIVVRGKTAGKTVLIFDDTFTDPLVGLARLTDNISQGREGHAAVADDAFYIAFHVWNRPENKVRLRMRSFSKIVGKKANETADVIMDRATVVETFKKLLQDIANDPDFGHQFVCYDNLDEEQYDQAEKAAELEWKRLVDSGETNLDDGDAQERLLRKYVREMISLKPADLEYLEKYKRMLITYQIPDGWN